ncbi:asparagine synthase-related protein [Thermocatellispora tengchongensis]|uniref:asparagine synthase-related protein n=1 Tax=Thermocatellispora tengchongensis TaxID=1073253 RepID=UPI00363392D1
MPTAVLDLARASIEVAFPVPREAIRPAEWHGTGVSLLAWTNEPDDTRTPGTLTVDPAGRRAVGVSGYLSAPPDVARLLRAENLGVTTDALPGCLAAFRAGEDGELSAATSITRACPVFHAETPDLYVVGNRALLVHLAARGRVEWDVLALEMMVRQGYFLSDETPFLGVTALPPSSSITIRDGRRTITTFPLPHARPAPADPKGRKALVEDLADALLTTVEPLRAASEPVNLALTGGRDSRLMAALLHAARIPFRATTNGLDDHPDVVIARSIAAALGIEHTVIPPKQTEKRDAVMVEHLLLRTHETLRTCEGMTSAYESIVGYLPYSAKPTMSGQSGEILRGSGFLLLPTDLSPRGLRRRVDNYFLKTGELFTDAANEHARALAAPWQAMDNGFEALEHMYVAYKVGRWHAAARAGSLRRGDAVIPFLDAHVVRPAMTMDHLWRRSEEVVFELIDTFAPELCRIPVDGKPWRFLAEAGEDAPRRREHRRIPRPWYARRPRAAGTGGRARGRS